MTAKNTLPVALWLRNLGGSIALLCCTAIVAVALGFAIDKASREAAQTQRQMQVQLEESRARLARAQEDEREIRARIDRYHAIVASGRTQPERRLEWVEALRDIKERRRLISMEYEISPQQPLDANHVVTGGYAFLTSPMRLEMALLHEDDLLGTLAELARMPPLVSVKRCRIERLPPNVRATVAATLHAQCELDWITLREKL